MGSIMWFRRDLRLADNPALHAALEHGPSLGLFVVDPALWNPSGPRRRAYLAASLAALHDQIRRIGGPGLSVVYGDPVVIVPELAHRRASLVFATGDWGPYGRARDARVAAACAIAYIDSPYQHPPGAVAKPDGSAYRVFTPYWRRWQSLPTEAPLPQPVHWDAPEDPLAAWQLPHVAEAPVLQCGEGAALHRLQGFLEERLAGYAQLRDFPASDGTSGLSTALKFGELHPRTIVAEARGLPGAEGFVRQLCWRDFYAQILAERPDSARRNYQPAFDRFPWRSDARAGEDFQAWCEGRTGYPFVDAGMRHLAATGQLPNRLRMVVASFLVKDLHLDWRLGARYFMQQLVDGDLANNQHGWQWTAGTGTDAAPYYRIFNPVAQGLRFDPEGAYVHRWVPELAALPGAAVHTPWQHPRELWLGYPHRIVDHAAEREVAMALYRSVAGG